MSRLVAFFCIKLVGVLCFGNLFDRVNVWRCVSVAGRVFWFGLLGFLISMFFVWFRKVVLCFVMVLCGCIVVVNVWFVMFWCMSSWLLCMSNVLLEVVCMSHSHMSFWMCVACFYFFLFHAY